MSKLYEAQRLQGSADISNSNASETLIASPGSNAVIVVENINISIYKAASGGGGEVRVQDSDGNVLLRVDADSVKDIPTKEYGRGYRFLSGTSVQALVAGAATENASASIQIIGHLSFAV